MKIFDQGIKYYKAEIDKVLDLCAEKKDYDLLAKVKIKHTINNKPVDVLPQHALYNAIIEAYLPEGIDMVAEKLYYFGDFSKDDLDDYMKKMHSSIWKFANKVAGKFHPDKYFRDIDNFNIENKDEFDSGDLKYEKWEDLWNDLVAVEPSKSREGMMNAREIYSIIMQNIQFSFTLYSYIFDEKCMVFFNGLNVYEDICKIDAEASNIIKHSIFNNDDSIFVTLDKRNKAAKYIMNIISKHKIEPLNTMVQSSSVKEEQLTDMIVGLGIKPFINDASRKLHSSKMTRPYGSYVYSKTIHASYIRGLKTKEDHFVDIASAVTSLTISKNKIADIADLNKKLTLVSKRMVINPDRNYKCNTKYFRSYTINKESDLKRIEGMYEQVGAKTIKIDHNNFPKYQGRTIQLRTPALCNVTLEGGICRYCMGDHMYDLNDKWYFKEGQSCVATVWVNVVGPIAQQALLSAKHNASPNPLVPTYWTIKDMKADHNIKNYGVSFTYAFEDRVFIDLNGVGIIPDKLELVHPERMYMPWTNERIAYFSHRIKFVVDLKEYVVESDTLFFIYEDEISNPEINLRHLYQNIGITSLFYKLVDATAFSTKNTEGLAGVNRYLDSLDAINPREHVTFFHVLFADMIRDSSDISKIVDFSQEGLDLRVVNINSALRNGHNLTNTFATGYFDKDITNYNNYSTNNKIVVDTDNVI
jgi:hypothetical protein